ncbi:MAG: hypothetical protein KatS3mg009_3357 [Acidimicrobiia bacterium]|nr:MAG: hypothetical protein KatS3mg009_3357 [Acidimicrobiia bacterium]
MSDETVDIARVRAEIAAEVRARRAAGEYPASLERELDELFARFAPKEVSESLGDALERSEEAAAIAPEIPVASNNPLFGLVKRVLARLLGWYHVFVAQQVTAATVAVNHVLRRLVDKVTRLERATGDAARARESLARVVPTRDDASWEDAVTAALRGVTGRVLVGECGDGRLLAALSAAGLDAYGVEPRPELAETALAQGLEVRLDDVPGHLGTVAPGDLAGIVLRGCVERMPAGELVALADLAAAALAPGGRVVVASTAPPAWGRERTEVEADLAAGRPLHAATWQHLLAERGFPNCAVTTIGGRPLEPVAAGAPDADVLNANLARISDVLFGPDAYVLVATRDR